MVRVIVGITGTTGVMYGVRLLDVLRAAQDVETHLVLTPAARATLQLETDVSPEAVEALADVVHRHGDIAAAPSSGSARFDAMAVVPCSMRTAAAIAYSLDDNLLVRAADVMLKERRRLVVAPRETPLHLGHLRALVQLAEIGATVAPLMPAFYSRPTTIGEIVDQSVNRICDLLDIELPNDLFTRWSGRNREAVDDERLTEQRPSGSQLSEELRSSLPTSEARHPDRSGQTGSLG